MPKQVQVAKGRRETGIYETAQQEKMKVYNKDAADKKLKGDERKKFISSCLSA